jgi:hypothetical protein
VRAGNRSKNDGSKDQKEKTTSTKISGGIGKQIQLPQLNTEDQHSAHQP